MANEYLRRTPTSTGNRKVFTWSAWIKRNKLGGGSDTAIFASSSSDVFRIRFTGTDKIDFIYFDGTNYGYSGTQVLRDTGGWMHIMISLDSTDEIGDNRMMLFINGVHYIGDKMGTQVPINTEFPTNSLITHWIGCDNGPNGYWNGQIADVFFVDGQALTPDVFGFYKEGKGYVSAGSTQATDFRPGQWVPKAPRTIKTEINRKGGFGVNGYYLPMNDSSNFGADFHTTPNSIITLKGEDLPQPRNGAPTTTDAYVSQLRSDPYAANLVLAVPGISTSTSANLVTNGTFDTNTTGWTAGNSGTLSVDAGRLKVTNGTSSAGYAYQEITVEVGKRYTVNLEGITGTSASNTRIGTAANAADYGNKIGSGLVNISFTATSTSLYVTLKPNSNTNGNNALFDNVVVKQEDAPRDYSADIKGSGTNKTLTANGNAGVGYELGNYYGSAMTFDGTDDYFDAGSSSDFDFGSGDFTVEYWQNANSFTPAPGLGVWDSPNNQRSWLIYQNSSALPRFYTSVDGTNSVSVDATGPTIPTNQWTHFCMERSGSTLFGYINGVCVGVNTNLGTQSLFTPVDPLWIGRWSSNYTNAYIQDLRVYKGVAKYKGVGFDVPKPYTPVGIATWRAVPDTTANNFATWNPLSRYSTESSLGLSNGNLTATADASVNKTGTATVGVTTGKWYYEFSSTSANSYFEIGIGTYAGSGSAVNGLNYKCYSGNIEIENVSQTTVSSLGANEILGIAFNATDGQTTFYKDGVGIATISFTSPSGLYIPQLQSANGATHVGSANFGQNPTFSGSVSTAGTFTDSNGKGLFKYEPPTGFLALCEDNLPTPAIADPGDYFKSVLWTGDGNSGRSITGVGFQPDFVWLKTRTAIADNHKLIDTVRGAPRTVYSNLTQTELIETTGLLSFDTDGFSIGSDSGNNGSGRTFVAWCWKAGGAAVSNTDGGVTSQVSVNQTAGFSIIKVDDLPASTTSTFGHGLNKKPDFIIFKSRNNSTNWDVYHSSLTPDGERKLYLNGTNAEIDSVFMGDTPPTSSVISFNPGSSNSNHIVYCWTEIEGFSKFGSYIGNASTDGPFVYCGFKPAWVLVKSAVGGTGYWVLWDSSRTPTNLATNALVANTNWTETPNFDIDLLSNGFKMRDAEGSLNASGVTYIFAAFAESPFTTANAK